MDYTIKSGDTLSALAKSNNTDIATIQKLNPAITNPDVIQAGATLKLPGQPAAPAAAPVADAGTGAAQSTTAPAQTTPVQTSAQIRSALNATGTPSAAVVGQTFDQFKTSVAPDTAAPPALPTLEQKYADERAAQGIPAIEDSIATNEAQIAALQLSLTKFKQTAFDGVSSGFAQGRVSEDQRNIQDQIDSLTIQNNLAYSKLSLKNDTIKSIMDYTSQDYANAKDAYETQFNQNLQLQNSYTNTQYKDITADDKTKNDARATLTTISNLMANSGMDITTALAGNPSMKTQINNLELQAGYPSGTLETFARAKPNSNVLVHTTGYDASGNQVVTVVSKDKAGNLSTTHMQTGGKKPPTKASTTAPKGSVTSGSLTLQPGQVSTISSRLTSVDGKDRVSAYQSALSGWQASGGLPKDFFKEFPIKTYFPDPTILPPELQAEM